METFFLEYIHAVIPYERITNKLKYYSQKITVGEIRRRQTATGGRRKDKVNIDGHTCQDAAVVRYMISEAVGMNLLQYFDKVKQSGLPVFRFAIEIGIKVIDLLEIIYDS